MSKNSTTKSCQTRREFLRHTTLTAAAIPALGPAILGAENARKPNLLVLWTDEQRADTMAVYGNHKIQAPNLNKLASESAVFERAYVSQPVCTPSRATVMSGLWPHQSGCTTNNIALPADVAAFPELVADPDYHAGYFGKWHLGDEIFPQHGFQEWRSIEDGYWQYYGEDRDLDARSDYHRFLAAQGYTPNTSRGDFSRSFAARLPIEHCKPAFLEREACEFLRRRRNEPFMLYVNFLEPHMPFYGPLDSLHDPAEVNLPANFDDPLEENEPEVYRQARENLLKKGFDDFDLQTEQSWRRLIANYWGLVTQIDRSIGAILDTLENLGLADNTIVVHTSDHGDMMGAHRMLTKGVMYEEAVRVPWLMRVPALGRRQRLVSGPASHIDLVPTLLDLMSAKTERALPGQSLRPRIEGQPVEEDHVYIQWNPGGLLQEGRNPHGKLRAATINEGHAARAVIAPDGWKLTLHRGDRNQLFNLKTDPGETTNVYGAPENREVIERLTQRIHAWQAKVNDPLKMEA